MTFIEITGHVNENGELEYPKPVNLPPGDVLITIETLAPDAEADEALWDKQLANPSAGLIALINKAQEDYEKGLTENLTDEDFGDNL